MPINMQKGIYLGQRPSHDGAMYARMKWGLLLRKEILAILQPRNVEITLGHGVSQLDKDTLG